MHLIMCQSSSSFIVSKNERYVEITMVIKLRMFKVAT